MTEKEKEVQRALGLEKGYITQLTVEVPVYVSVSIIARGFSEKEVRDRLWELPDDVKKQVILHTCMQIVDAAYGDVDKRDLGEQAVDEIRTIAHSAPGAVDPKILNNDYIEIDTTGNNTIADAIKYMKEELGMDRDDILII